MTLFERVFGGNDAVYGLTEAAIDNAIAQYGEGQAVSFPDTAYSLPCYYAVTGSKVGTLGELKQLRDPGLDDGTTAVAAAQSVIPVMLVYLFFQEKVTDAMVNSGLKG